MTNVAERLTEVRARLAAAAAANNRPVEAIRLVAVSKKKPARLIRQAYAAGQRDFGENYVQELLQKAEACADLPDIRWHMIGHLQRNKARQVVRAAAVVHTLDSERLAEELGRRAADAVLESTRRYDATDRRLATLVEINVSGEARKSGCTPEELASVLEAVEREAALRLVGLMTMPPFSEDAAAARPYFERLRQLRDEHGGTARLPELSMGMTADLEQAIAAGATMVRVGTAIFGIRGE
jgi:hypothetical protein